MTDYYVGQKVVCIDDRGAEWCLELKAVYTVLGLEGQCLIIDCTPDDVGCCGWRSARFRPLVETKSEVSFTIGADPDSEKWDNRKVKVK